MGQQLMNNPLNLLTVSKRLLLSRGGPPLQPPRTSSYFKKFMIKVVKFNKVITYINHERHCYEILSSAVYFDYLNP